MSTSPLPLNALAPGHLLLNHLEQAVLRIDAKQTDATDYVTDATQVLEPLPLTTEEYATTRNRLRNTAHYLNLCEWGAAHYEIQLVCGWLRLFNHNYKRISAII